MTSIERVAGFDIGTNSLRVLIADVDTLSRIVASIRLGFAVRLGEGVSSTGRVSEAALERTARVLGKSVLLARRLGTSRMLAGATHVLRVAANAADVVSLLEEAASLPIEILTPQEEAYYVYTGALSESFSTAFEFEPGSGLSEDSGKTKCGSGDFLARAAGIEASFKGGFVVDIGGGSTSLIKGTGVGTVQSFTLPLGCVTLTEQFLKHDPPLPGEIRDLCDHMETELSKSTATLLPEIQNAVTGVGGAVTSIAAVSLELQHFESRLVEGQVLTIDEIEKWAQRLSRLPIDKRAAIPGLDRRRAEIAVAGAYILSLLTRHLNVKRLTVSTRGLRYGLALEAAALPAD